MKLESLSYTQNPLIQDLLLGPGAPPPARSGVHVTDLIHGIQYELNIDGRADQEDTGEDIPEMYRILGLAWEHVVTTSLCRQSPGRYLVQSVVSLDGLFGTIDLFDLHTNEVVECKLTWKSTRRDALDNFAWMSQIKAYMRMTGAHSTRLYAAYVNGNWSPPRPSFVPVRLTASDVELNENWGMLLRYRDKLLNDGRLQST